MELLIPLLLGHHGDTHKDVTHDDFISHINKCNIRYMFFYLLLYVKPFISKIMYK